MITNYKWDLDGNGSFETDTGTTPSTSRSYSAAGNVIATLRVTDNDGATSDASRTVTIAGQGSGARSTTPAPPATQLSCKTLKKKRAALTRRLKSTRRKLVRSHRSAAKRRYRKQIKSFKKRLNRLRTTPCRH